MILDLAKMPDGTVFEADVCVVGAGAMGIAVALEFFDSATRVLVLESGGFKPEAETQGLYKSDVLGVPPVGTSVGRARVLGGTTTIWGGQSARFRESDFSIRKWIPHSGWPLGAATLAPYYDRAERMLHVVGHIGYSELIARFGVEPPAFDNDRLLIECTQWSTRPNFARAYGKLLERVRSITVLLHANVTELIPNASGTAVDRAEFRTLDGIRGLARARFHVLCSGAIETSRLLLASNRSNPRGLGNEHDLVGRFFQDHLWVDAGELVPRDQRRIHDLFEGFFWQGCKQTPKLALGQDIQQREGILDGQAEVIFEQPPNSSAAALKNLVKSLSGQRTWPGSSALLRAVGSPLEMIRMAHRYRLKNRSAAPARSRILIGVQTECAPQQESRVTLSQERDKIGMPRVRVAWRIGDLERRTLSVLLKTVSDEIRRVGLGELTMRTELSKRLASDSWRDLVHDQAHHMGTARMSHSAKYGVVDSNNRVFGVGNLYLAGMAIFPTSTRLSPTLTAIALSIRLADRLKAKLSQHLEIST